MPQHEFPVLCSMDYVYGGHKTAPATMESGDGAQVVGLRSFYPLSYPFCSVVCFLEFAILI